MKNASFTKTINDVQIHYQIAGREDAPTLVFLHGNGENLHIFEQQLSYFSRHYKVIAVDTRGHGQSTRGKAPFNFYTFANDLIAVLDALEINKAHIVGFSDGGITALHAVLIAPERIASLVLLGVNYHSKGLNLFPLLEIRFVYACLSIVSLFSAKMRRKKEIWGLMVDQPNLTIEKISQITAPTLIVTGEKDMISQAHTDELNQSIANSQQLIIPNSDHFWMFKQPEVLNDCIRKFLSNHFDTGNR
jgi:pimeloyl-ACP methyl ester carboxylesterase